MIDFYYNVAAFTHKYDCFVLDLWGVIHDGRTVYPGAINCLAQLKQRNKSIILLSNSSMTADQLVADLEHFGIEARYYDLAITAGEITREVLRHNLVPWGAALGKKYYYIGPQDRSALFAGLDRGYVAVDSLSEAEFVLITGRLPTLDQPQDYYDLGRQIAALGIPILCPNPDISIVQMDGTIHVCAGGIAKFCEKQCACKVYYVGKPDPLVYKYSFDLIAAKLNKTFEPSRIIAIGDTLETDVQGAINSNIDACLTASGITAFKLFKQFPVDVSLHPKLAAYCSAVRIVPQIIVPRLVW